MRGGTLLCLVAAGCAGVAAPVVMVHPRFAALRPAMVAVRVEGAGDAGEALADALYRGLLAKDYSVLAPGAPAGAEAGFFRARLLTEEAPFQAEAVFEDPAGTAIYRARVAGFDGDASRLAAVLLEGLPAKR